MITYSDDKNLIKYSIDTMDGMLKAKNKAKKVIISEKQQMQKKQKTKESKKSKKRKSNTENENPNKAIESRKTHKIKQTKIQRRETMHPMLCYKAITNINMIIE